MNIMQFLAMELDRPYGDLNIDGVQIERTINPETYAQPGRESTYSIPFYFNLTGETNELDSVNTLETGSGDKIYTYPVNANLKTPDLFSLDICMISSQTYEHPFHTGFKVKMAGRVPILIAAWAAVRLPQPIHIPANVRFRFDGLNVPVHVEGRAHLKA